MMLQLFNKLQAKSDIDKRTKIVQLGTVTRKKMYIESTILRKMLKFSKTKECVYGSFLRHSYNAEESK